MGIISGITGAIKAVSAATAVHEVAKLASQTSFHFNVFSLLLIAVCLCAIAFMVSRFVPKKVAVSPETPSTLQIPMTNIPLDYQEYLKHQAYDKQLDGEEKFSFGKMFSGFGKGLNYAKAFVIGVIMFVMLFVGYGVYKEVKSIFVKPPAPIASSITNSGTGSVESKNESKSETKQNNGFSLNIFGGWF